MDKGRARAIRRGQRILDVLYARGVIDGPDYAMARLQIAQLHSPSAEPRPLSALHAILELERRDWGASRREPMVRTSLDLDQQRYLEDLARRMLEKWHEAGAQQTAVIVLRRRSREVLAWLGSAGYFDGAHGAIDCAQVPRARRAAP